MRRVLSTLILSLGAAWLAPAPAADQASAPAGEVVHGTRVRMTRPAGFTVAQQFSGYLNREDGSSIMVTELPAPFAKATAGFDEAGCKSRGMTLESKQNVSVGKYAGLLIALSQAAYGKLYRKWMLSFGDDTQTIVVTASWPEGAGDLSAAMKSAVLTARLDETAPPPSLNDLTFTMGSTPRLTLARRVQNLLIYTESGQLAGSRRSPFYIVGQSISEIAVEDPKGFARRRLGQVAGISSIAIEDDRDINVDGLSGRELVAAGVDVKSGGPMSVYQTMLFDKNTYYLFQGLVGKERKAEFLPAFKEATRGFKRKGS